MTPSIEELERDARAAADAFSAAEADYYGGDHQNGKLEDLNERAEALVGLLNRLEPRQHDAIITFGEVHKRAYEHLTGAKGSPAERRQLAAGQSQKPAHALTDVGNVERFCEDHAGELIYVPGPGYYGWDGRRHRLDDDGAAMRAAIDTAKSNRQEAVAIGDPDKAKPVFAWALQSEKRARLEAMVELGKVDKRMIVRVDKLDSDPLAFNVENGTIDLRSADLRGHNRADLITRVAPVEYDPDAKSEKWERAVALMLDDNAKLIRYVQKVLGYAMTADTREQCLFVFHGGGGNGRTTFLEAVRSVFGEYAVTANPKVFLRDRNDRIRNDVARLRGARFVTAVETGQGGQLDEVLVKQMTGGDMMTARFLYREEFEFVPECKVFLATNHLPEIEGTDDAIWDRVRLIKCERRIRGTELDNKRLLEELRRERSGILSWLVQGCLAWQREGLGTVPDVAAATNDYRSGQDHVAQFIAECCVVSPEATTSWAQLYSAYESWCKGKGVSPYYGERALGSSLKNRGYRPDKGSGNVAIRVGIGLLEASR